MTVKKGHDLDNIFFESLPLNEQVIHRKMSVRWYAITVTELYWLLDVFYYITVDKMQERERYLFEVRTD